MATRSNARRIARRRTLAMLLALCCAGGIIGGEGHAADPPVVTIVVENYQYKPAELTVKVGTTVEWVNKEARTSHSVIWAGGTESDRFFPGESYRRKFDRPGRFPYSCGPHPEMKGLVIVTE